MSTRPCVRGPEMKGHFLDATLICVLELGAPSRARPAGLLSEGKVIECCHFSLRVTAAATVA